MSYENVLSSFFFMDYLYDVWVEEGKQELTEDYYTEELQRIAGNSDNYALQKEYAFDRATVHFQIEDHLKVINWINECYLTEMGEAPNVKWSLLTITQHAAYWIIREISLEEFQQWIDENNKDEMEEDDEDEEEEEEN